MNPIQLIEDIVSTFEDAILTESQAKVINKAKGFLSIDKFVPGFTEIYDAVFKVTGITEKQIKGKDRYLPISQARFMFCYLCRKEGKMKYKWIGLELGRDHTTILHAVKAFEDFLFTDWNDSNFKLKEAMKLLYK